MKVELEINYRAPIIVKVFIDYCYLLICLVVMFVCIKFCHNNISFCCLNKQLPLFFVVCL